MPPRLAARAPSCQSKLAFYFALAPRGAATRLLHCARLAPSVGLPSVACRWAETARVCFRRPRQVQARARKQAINGRIATADLTYRPPKILLRGSTAKRRDLFTLVSTLVACHVSTRFCIWGQKREYSRIFRRDFSPRDRVRSRSTACDGAIIVEL